MNIFSTFYLLAFVISSSHHHRTSNDIAIPPTFCFSHHTHYSSYPLVMPTTILTLFTWFSLILLSLFFWSCYLWSHILAICCPLILPLISGSAIQRSDLGLGVQDGRGRRVFVSRGIEGAHRRVGGGGSLRGGSRTTFSNIRRGGLGEFAEEKIITYFHDRQTLVHDLPSRLTFTSRRYLIRLIVVPR
jgi:hypothetical protein